MITKRSIRKSSYGDYFAIDNIAEDNQIIETILYLKKGEEREVKIRWDYSATNSNGTFQQSCMLKGFIKFDGQSVYLSYNPEELSSGGEKYWWEATEYELTNKAITHFNPAPKLRPSST